MTSYLKSNNLIFPLHTVRLYWDGAISMEGVFKESMKNSYELALVVRVDSNESVMNETIDQVKAWVETDELGEVTKIDRWGRKKLAYEIDRQREGYYVLMYANIDTQYLNELERNLKLASGVLRYLIIRPDA